jgi:hypothetical protein
MFCPECRAEYRPDFTRCADCDVDLVQELPVELSGTEKTLQRTWSGRTERPTQDSIEWFRTKSLTKSVTFGLHQFIGMYGIPFTAPLVFSLAFKFLLLFGHSYPRKTFYSMVTGTPYFPVQIIFALLLGWLLGRALRHRSMVWVWVLPFAILCYSLLTATVLIPEWTSVLARPDVGQSWFSHYFGRGCQPAAHCLDQLLITMPFYSSLAYSVGAFLARRMVQSGHAASRKLFFAVMSAGLIIILSIAIDLITSLRQTGWQSSYWLVLATPVGLGTYVLYVASTIRRQLICSACVKPL